MGCDDRVASSCFALGECSVREASFCFTTGGVVGKVAALLFVLDECGGGITSFFVLGRTLVSSRLDLGGSGGRALLSSFIFGVRGGTLDAFWFVLGGSEGGLFLPSCRSSMLSGSLGSKRISSSENFCGGIGGGKSSVSSGLWG